MYLERLDISCFRNLTSVSLEPAPGLNFFFGANGAGKTAILEATHVLARGRSFRTRQARTLVQHGAEALMVRANVRDDGGVLQRLAMSKDTGGQTVLRINGEAERRLSEAARRIPLQVMLPDISELVFGSPQLRRQWLDWGTFHVKPDYLACLRDFMRALQQRNAGLKQVAAGREPDASLAVWTERLVEEGERVTEMRLAYLGALEPLFAQTLERLAPELDVRVGYQQGWNEGERLDKVLGDLGPRELKLGSTQAGPHRADVELRVGPEPDAAQAALQLSRGQGKSVASALKIAQARLLTELEGRGSVFLIDDVGAELDDEHNSRFFQLLQDMDCQVLATSAHPPGEFVSYFTDTMINVFHVERGDVHRSPNG